jgi:hypothetical protein
MAQMIRLRIRNTGRNRGENQPSEKVPNLSLHAMGVCVSTDDVVSERVTVNVRQGTGLLYEHDNLLVGLHKQVTS